MVKELITEVKVIDPHQGSLKTEVRDLVGRKGYSLPGSYIASLKSRTKESILVFPGVRKIIETETGKVSFYCTKEILKTLKEYIV